MNRHQTAASTESMDEMNTSRPLLLIVVTLCLVMVAIAVFWLAAVPHQILGSLKRSMESESGYVLEASSPHLSLRNGIVLMLDNVSLSNTSSTSLTAQNMEVKTNFATLFGGGLAATDISFNKAVITVDVTQTAQLPKFSKGRVVLKETILRLKDEERLGVINLSDVNGIVATLPDGSVKADIGFLFGDRLTTFNGEVESVERLFTTGSPADITLSAANMLVGFSGRVKVEKSIALTGQSNIEGDDAAALFRWLGMPLETFENTGRFTLLGGISTQGLSAQFENITAILGRETISGRALLSVGPDKMGLEGELDVSRISLFPATNLLTQPWSEKPLSIADVSAVNLNVLLKTKSLRLRGEDFGALSVQVKTSGNRTTVSLPPQSIAGGEGDAEIAFTQDKGALTVETTINAKSVKAEAVLGGVLGLYATEGILDINTELKMQGNSLAALVSSMSGTAKLTAKSLAVSGVDLVNSLTVAGNGWHMLSGAVAMPIDLVGVAQLNEGASLLESFSIKYGTTSAKPRGELDLLRQNLALQLSPKLVLSGPWTAPTRTIGQLRKDKIAVTPPAN